MYLLYKIEKKGVILNRRRLQQRQSQVGLAVLFPPCSINAANQCALLRSRVYIPAANPNGVLLERRTTSSLVSNGRMVITGSKIPSQQIVISSCTFTKIVNFMKAPFSHSSSLIRICSTPPSSPLIIDPPSSIPNFTHCNKLCK